MQPRHNGNNATTHDQHKLDEPQPRQPPRRWEQQRPDSWSIPPAVEQSSDTCAFAPRRRHSERIFSAPTFSPPAPAPHPPANSWQSPHVRLLRHTPPAKPRCTAHSPPPQEKLGSLTSAGRYLPPVPQRSPASPPSPTTRALPAPENTKVTPPSGDAPLPAPSPANPDRCTVSASVNSSHFPFEPLALQPQGRYFFRSTPPAKAPHPPLALPEKTLAIPPVSVSRPVVHDNNFKADPSLNHQ